MTSWELFRLLSRVFRNRCSKCIEKWKFNIYWLIRGTCWKLFKMYQNSNLMATSLAAYVMPLSRRWSGVTFKWAYKYNYGFKKTCKWGCLLRLYSINGEWKGSWFAHTVLAPNFTKLLFFVNSGIGALCMTPHSFYLKNVENCSTWWI